MLASAHAPRTQHDHRIDGLVIQQIRSECVDAIEIVFVARLGEGEVDQPKRFTPRRSTELVKDAARQWRAEWRVEVAHSGRTPLGKV